MANELRITIGAEYQRGHSAERFGLPVKLIGFPRKATDGRQYRETIFVASGVDQVSAGLDAGVVSVTGVEDYYLDTYNNKKIQTNGWLFMQNLEGPSGSYIEFGPRVKFVSCDGGVEQYGPDDNSTFTYTDITQNSFTTIMFGRMEPGESAAMRISPSGVTVGLRAGCGLADIATTGAPSVNLKYIMFND